MPDERLSAAGIKAAIREAERELCRLKDQLNDLTKQEHDAVLEELKPLINKCFVREIKNPDKSVTRHYAVITGYPPIEMTQAGVSFNRYQLPAVHFYLGDRHFYPCLIDSGHGPYNDVFFFENIFTGELPQPYKGGAHNTLEHAEWTECSRTDFITAAAERYQEYIAKIFETTTPDL